ncbi:MAG TPA: Ig-like domain-containing protein [Candidatus Thermoplasmatota archaeon]|nr:Ig-like domain-containing protein [Candidatus Thermoplasmatota archaeon]
MALMLLLAAASLAALPTAVAVDTPGPDRSAHQYRSVDNNGQGWTGWPAPTYNYQSAGTKLNLANEQTSSCINLGFTFAYYGNEYTCVYVASNGYISFLPGPTLLAPSASLPMSGVPNAMVAGFWTNLDPSDCSNGVYVGTVGSAPNRVFLAEWRSVKVLPAATPTSGGGGVTLNTAACNNGQPAPPAPLASFVIKLFESSGLVEVHLADARPNNLNGNTPYRYAIGIEDPTGQFGLSYANNAGAPFLGRVVRFVPNSSPVVDPVTTAPVQEGSSMGFPLSATDANGDPIRGFCVEQQPTLGKEVKNIPACATDQVSAMPPPLLDYTAPKDACGTDTLTVRAQDIIQEPFDFGLLGPEREIVVDVVCRQDAPTIDVIPEVTMYEDTVATVTVKGISSGPGDPEGVVVKAMSVDPHLLPDPQTTFVADSGTLTMTLAPLQDQHGTATVRVQVTEDMPGGKSVQRAFKVHVLPQPDAPVAQPMVVSGPSPILITPTVTDVDGSGNFLLEVVAPPSQGSVSGKGPFTYRANRFTCGADSFTYRASDGVLWSEPARIDVMVTCPDNFPPVAQSQQVQVAYMTPRNITLGGVDHENHPLTVHISRLPGYGTLEGVSEKVYRYTPQRSFCGEDSFEFRVADHQYPSSEAALVSLIVGCPQTDQLPTAKSFSIAARTGESVPVVLSGHDPEGRPLLYVIESFPQRGTLSQVDGNRYLYRPTTPFEGMDVLQYRVDTPDSPDDTRSSLPATVTLHFSGTPAVQDTGQAAGEAPASGPSRKTRDGDGDGVPDHVDNCPRTHNASQGDMDRDGIGDLCDPNPTVPHLAPSTAPAASPASAPDASEAQAAPAPASQAPDADGDTVIDSLDNCPSVANVGQADLDRDGFGDACDADRDGDGVPDAEDLCPAHAIAAATDFDGDGIGDACDPDADNDGILDRAPNGALLDNCQLLANPTQADMDGDGWGDACDPDPDGDGTPGYCDRDCQKRRSEVLQALQAPASTATTTLAFVGAGFLVVVALVVAALPFFARPRRPEGPQ